MVGGVTARNPAPGAAAALASLAFAAACAAFAWQPALATFADDSVSYLVMAQVFSPYAPASGAVAAAFPREAVYPPLFPALLALCGAAHNIAWAHALTALLLAGALPFVYLLGRRWLGGGWMAAAAVCCIALLPALWIGAKGILSEPLFCLLLVATLAALEQRGSEGGNARWPAALLMIALAMTRAAALPMLAAHALWAATRRAAARARMREAAPALAGLAAYALWMLLRPAHVGDGYARVLGERGQELAAGAGGLLGALWTSVARQANALLEGWAGSLIIFWVEGRPLRLVLACAAGAFALGGLALRLARGKADGWMIAAYLATLLAWPFQEQMERFLLPVVPVLVLYALLAAGECARALRRPAVLGQGLLALLLLALSVPAMGFIYQRARSPGREAWIVDWYRTPDLSRARVRARVQLDLLDDMAAIRTLTRPQDRVMWVAPGYIALLADRRGVAAPSPALAPERYREAVAASGADYVFLSRYHPRDTVDETAWLAGVRALARDLRSVHAGAREGGTAVSSLLLKAAP